MHGAGRSGHHCLAPEYIEKALGNIPLGARVLMFRGSDSDIVERLFSYDTEPGELNRADLC